MPPKRSHFPRWAPTLADGLLPSGHTLRAQRLKKQKIQSRLKISRGLLAGRFGYFLSCFSARGRGRGSARRRAGVGRFFMENPRRGSLPGGWGHGGEGAGR